MNNYMMADTIQINIVSGLDLTRDTTVNITLMYSNIIDDVSHRHYYYKELQLEKENEMTIINTEIKCCSYQYADINLVYDDVVHGYRFYICSNNANALNITISPGLTHPIVRVNNIKTDFHCSYLEYCGVPLLFKYLSKYCCIPSNEKQYDHV